MRQVWIYTLEWRHSSASEETTVNVLETRSMAPKEGPLEKVGDSYLRADRQTRPAYLRTDRRVSDVDLSTWAKGYPFPLPVHGDPVICRAAKEVDRVS